MKAIFIISTFLLVITHFSYAQDAKVSSGVVAYSADRYEEALEQLSKALQYPSSLKAKNLPKAYYYRSLTWLALMSEKTKAKDYDWFTKYPKVPIKAYEDCKMAQKHDNGKWTDKIQSQYTAIRAMLMQYGLTNLTQLQRSKAKNDKQVFYKDAMLFFEAALEIEKEYLVLDLMSQAEFSMNFANLKGFFAH